MNLTTGPYEVVNGANGSVTWAYPYPTSTAMPTMVLGETYCGVTAVRTSDCRCQTHRPDLHPFTSTRIEVSA
jgi:hypothetical protein